MATDSKRAFPYKTITTNEINAAQGEYSRSFTSEGGNRDVSKGTDGMRIRDLSVEYAGRIPTGYEKVK